MDLHLFDLNLLVALDALLRECNVTQAGNRLNLSQPAMSGALARLRSHFKDDLLVSVGRRMVRTPLGDELVQPVADLLLQARATLESRSGFDPTSSTRHLTIAASDYVMAILMADALRRVRCEAPHMTFDLRPLGPRAGEALDSADLDFLIAPASAEFEAHASEVLFEDLFTCVAWSGNEAVGETLSPEEYLNLGHVVVNVGQDPVGNIDEVYLRRSKHRRRIEISTPSFFLAPQLVVGTDRIATITTRLALKYVQNLPIKLVPLPIEIPPLVEVLHWHRAHDQDPAHLWFRRLLKRAVAALPSTDTQQPTTGVMAHPVGGGERAPKRS